LADDVARPDEEVATPSLPEFLEANRRYRANFTKGALPMPPGRKVAVLVCMDARIDPAKALGLEEGDAHVIRNAGGRASDDAIRSLAISQQLLGTREIIVIHHTDCGMLTFSDDDFRRQLIEETGVEPAWDAETFSDLAVDVRESIARIRDSPFIPEKGSIRGFVYDVHTGRLDEVT
jgi:carbonic anhydrase